MKDLVCSLNGVLLPFSEAALSVDDGGLLYGDGLFETLRIYGNRPFSLAQHLQRLETGAAFLEIPLPDRRELISAVEQVIRANNVQEGSMRITLTGGRGRNLLWPRLSEQGGTILITIRHSVPYPDHLYSRGSRAVLVSFPRNEASPLTKIKSLNFLENILGKREAVQQGVDEGIFINTKGELCEGTTSNIFLYDGKTLMTPLISCGILPGITRSAVLQLTRETTGIPVEERVLYPEDLEKAEEVFLTASIMEIMPLVEVEGKKISNGVPGPLSKMLLMNYRRQASSSDLGAR
ncbi:MAG TPA: aminotransferase class IV [Candidatus Limnocylindrales bacterium]|nr:aminotransferase class IV [Candidatus Limnocylindrales bacterium]